MKAYCDYCDGNEGIVGKQAELPPSKPYAQELHHETDGYFHLYYEGHYKFKFTYCPMCGRKL